MSGVVRLERIGTIGLIVIDRPPVNATSVDVRRGLCSALDAADADHDIQALVLACDGTTFVAGADVAEFDRPPLEPRLADVCDRIERSRVPVVAALHGTALGGGLELALACSARVALSSAKVGLPETRLGLIPGAGGTQRLPRLIGVARAFEVIATGEPLTASQALECGLVDEVVAADLRERAIALASTLATSSERRTLRARPVDPATVPAGGFAAVRADAKRRAKGVLAVERAVDALEASLGDFDEGMAAERAIFQELRSHPQSAALRHLFAAERAAGKWPGVAIAVDSLAVVGAGTMGAGIAISALDAGLHVTLIDVDPMARQRADDRLNAHYQGLVAKGRVDEATVRDRLARLHLESAPDGAANCDLAIEAVVENFAVKERVLAALHGVLPPHGVIATNTSYLDVARLGEVTGRPNSVIGLHFFSPAHVMPLVEVVRTERSDDTAIATGVALARRLRKQAVVVGNAPGFVGNAMFTAYGRENQRLLLEGALPWGVDHALQQWGMAMGPNAVLDLAGLDVGYRARRERTDLPDDPTFFRIADALVEAGRLGQKTGAGNYRYLDGARAGSEDPEVVALLERESARFGITRRAILDDEIVERCLAALVNEGAWLLHRGVARSKGDIDVIWTRGYGFPRWRGGPMHWAETVGAKALKDTVERLAATHGRQYWQPAPSLLAEAAVLMDSAAATSTASDSRASS